ncbi:FAD binding domain-containing protein [Ditylenchus destructor]|uniref:NADPH-dependent diflavin oxidoreductase 1 n=1 Tax=Ditylenchus destructor TaxID=166010 RepID=A0AAD4R110_9BILA|nr:FAD binding domain-containing protein [Ditylenchus destructor]
MFTDNSSLVEFFQQKLTEFSPTAAFKYVDTYLVLSVLECVLAVACFAIATNLVGFEFMQLFRLFRRWSADEIEFRRLSKLIAEVTSKMTKLSPVNDFAQYFKQDRIRNKLMDQRNAISQRISRDSFLGSMKVMLFARALFMLISMVLVWHVGNSLIIARIDSNLFFPFNFLLLFPASFNLFGFWLPGDGSENGSGDEIPIPLFNFLVMALFVRNHYIRRMTKASLLILFGSETGAAQDAAETVWREARQRRVPARVMAFDDYDIEMIPQEIFVIFVVATSGQGELPTNMRQNWRRLLSKKLQPNAYLAKVNIAVMGLGDSSYQKYNFAGKKVYRRLIQLGAIAVQKLGLADDQHPLGVDAAFEPWKTDLWNGIEALKIFEDMTSDIDPNLPLPSKYLLDFEIGKSNSSMGSLQHAPSDFLPLEVLSNKRVTAEDHFQDTRLITFSLESTEDVESRFKYRPGDVLNVYPYNLQHSVNMVILALEACKNRLDVPFVIQPAEENIPPPPTWLFPGQSATLRICLERYFDLQMVPRRSFLAMLSKFAKDSMEKDRLQELASAQGLDDYLDYCQRPRRTVAELLRDFPSTSASLLPQQLFDVMSAIRPRAFSIASSPDSTPHVIQLLVARVVYKARRMAESRRGICSNFICDLTPGNKITEFIATIWKYLAPLLLVGPGTGVAPFRSIIHTNERQNGNSVQILLFFGCRNSSKDFYFEDDWKECRHLTLATAFSRDQLEKFYVQHAIVQNEHVWEYLRNPNAKILIAGSANEMPKEVIKALKRVAESNGVDNVDDYFEELEKRNRIQFETWS